MSTFQRWCHIPKSTPYSSHKRMSEKTGSGNSVFGDNFVKIVILGSGLIKETLWELCLKSSDSEKHFRYKVIRALTVGSVI